MWIAISALNLSLAVILGAFGAHGLKSFATVEQLAWWSTATDYFFYHALGLFALSILAKVQPLFPIKFSFVCLQIGIILFCGSLYCMSLGFPRVFGAITPIGGAFMILGWLTVAWNAFRHR
ncbi:uncharacterized membrane protein YgdD (TMEM256/DUF423 family) [Acinetobacter calcoaceticus]|uniref:Uncharacterized membrane protein YgdD (TMEM256/DUF423 family) n=1 Tax=Acinetobacter calcoaceticus TaxID=471 RepID=A0A4R1XUU7_ACICA|nr:uncharacterized membrane protein YgdD (TMEM256/DUF423 family) [Acinetobacter calcoaceticus]